jgi:predicted NAD/FAD-binding protein
VRGGSARYVEKLTAPWRERIRLGCPVERVRRRPDGVLVKARGLADERFDHVFLACHADQALALLADPSPAEREVLGALPYQRNEALLHTDTTLLPRRRRAWAAWNYHVLPREEQRGAGVALTYNMNILQGIESRHTFCVTLNASGHVDPTRVIARLAYDHPLFTPEGAVAQQRHGEVSGASHAKDPVGRTHYCGAYWRYGFHEDGVVSARMALERFERIHDEQRALPRVA